VPRFGVLQFLVKATGQVTCFLLLYACVSIGEFSCGLQQLFSASISSTPPVVSVASFSFCLPHSTDYVSHLDFEQASVFSAPREQSAGQSSVTARGHFPTAPDSFYRRFGLLCIFSGLSAQGCVVLLPVSFLVPAGWCSSDLSCCCAKDLILSSVQDLLAGLASGFIHETCFVSHRQLCSYKQVKVQCVFTLCGSNFRWRPVLLQCRR
jgi:hypothetical protein